MTTPEELQRSADSEALHSIHALMDGTEWSADTLQDIAAVLKRAGLPVREPADDDRNDE